MLAYAPGNGSTAAAAATGENCEGTGTGTAGVETIAGPGRLSQLFQRLSKSNSISRLYPGLSFCWGMLPRGPKAWTDCWGPAAMAAGSGGDIPSMRVSCPEGGCGGVRISESGILDIVGGVRRPGSWGSAVVAMPLTTREEGR